MTEIRSPLRNLRVLEMTEALAGPYCAMLLGDLGADVIKIERPGVGDQSRRWGPPFVEGESAYFLSVNRNKRSVEIDFKTPEGLDLLHRLVATADVFVTNVPRMASLKRSRIDPDTLRGINPRLIYSTISGYGHTGPKANRSGYDIIAQGEAGLMAITGDPDGGPVRFPTAMADISAGIYSTIGILSALYARDNAVDGTGEGQVLDVALFDSQVTWLANIGSAVFATGERPARLGNDHPTITPYQPFETRDRMILVGVGTQALWERFCAILKVEEDADAGPAIRDQPGPQRPSPGAGREARGDLPHARRGRVARRARRGGDPRRADPLPGRHAARRAPARSRHGRRARAPARRRGALDRKPGPALRDRPDLPPAPATAWASTTTRSAPSSSSPQRSARWAQAAAEAPRLGRVALVLLAEVLAHHPRLARGAEATGGIVAARRSRGSGRARHRRSA